MLVSESGERLVRTLWSSFFVGSLIILHRSYYKLHNITLGLLSLSFFLSSYKLCYLMLGLFPLRFIIVYELYYLVSRLLHYPLS